jgi:dihydrofolate reductase
MRRHRPPPDERLDEREEGETMRKLKVFNHISLDGYIADAQSDMSWAYADSDDAEWNAWAERNASGGGTLVFGRVTYDLMVGYWPTPAAMQAAPVFAERMNSSPKVVFSRTLEGPLWNNTTLVSGDIVAEVAKMKQEPGDDMVIMGSGSIVAQLTEAGLIDEYQVVLNPIVLGSGKTMFEGVAHKVGLKLTDERAFKNGKVALSFLATA